MRIPTLRIPFLVLTSIASAFGAHAPKDFTLRGVAIGMDVATATRVIPAAKLDPNASDDKVGLAVYHAVDRSAVPADVEMQFIDGKLALIRGTYSGDELTRAGGDMALYERMRVRLGTEPILFNTAVRQGETFIVVLASWSFPDEGAMFSVDVTSEKGTVTGRVTVVDNAASTKLQDRQNRQPIGF